MDRLAGRDLKEHPGILATLAGAVGYIATVMATAVAGVRVLPAAAQDPRQHGTGPAGAPAAPAAPPPGGCGPGDRRTHRQPPGTCRERELAVAIGAGASNAEVAASLFMSEATVKAHASRLFTKLDVANRVQIAIVVHDADQS